MIFGSKREINKIAIILMAVILVGARQGVLPPYFHTIELNAAIGQWLSIIIIGCLGIGLLTVVNTDLALVIIIFSMLLSPEFKLADVPQRAVVVRIEDILLFVVFFSWLAKMSLHKQLGLLKYTPINIPIACYILVSVFSTVIGIAEGRVKPAISFFYFVKYSEYFMLFFMVTNNIKSKKQIKIFIIAILITCAIVCVYVNSKARFWIAGPARASAPFEEYPGEPNHLAGYLVLLFAVTFGIFLYSNSNAWKFWTATLSCFMMPAFLLTLSRGGYLAFVVMYLILVILTKKKKTLAIIILLVAILFMPFIIPNRAKERLTHMFLPGQTYETPVGRISLDQSAAGRVWHWRRVIYYWKQRPLFGNGITGTGFIDSQVARVLGETGLVGVWMFGWLMVVIFRNCLQIFKTVNDDLARGLSLGLLAGFVGLFFHGFTASTFIIVRIMEPFWFLMGVVISLPRLYMSQEQVETQLESRSPSLGL